ncbi:MAG: hypothetical protein FWF73_04370 [Spirochaetes bacterium]|nr:hypothetical protein [Spirochaetota bacterium]
MKLKSKPHHNESFKESLKFDDNDIDLSNRTVSIPHTASSRNLFLKRFNEEDLYSMMDKSGLIKHLKNMGFKNLITEIDADDAGINYMKLFWEEKTHAKQLIDLRVSESTFLPESKYFTQNTEILPYDTIKIEWLSAKNPLKGFDDNKPQLPGQANPGLGVLKFSFKILYIMAKLVFKDGFVDVPNHMHGAIMYSKTFKFFDPAHEGIIRAVIRDLDGYSLNDISWGIITETIIDLDKNRPAVYDPGVQIHYVSRRMKKYFNSKKYKETYKYYYKKKKYHFDYEEMIKRKEAILESKKIEDL